MKESLYKKDVNRVVLSGEISNLPEFVRYVPRPLISFDLISCRQRRSEEEEWIKDVNKIVLFDEETFLKTVKEGERYKFIGEMQSRNYNRVNEEIEELYVMAVSNYYDIMGEYPCLEEPDSRKKQPIDWRKLLSIGLIPEAPEDSMYDADMNKYKSQESPFVYLVDENGETTRESQHVTYEVLVKEYEKLEAPVDPLAGDINRVKMAGRVTFDPFFNVLGERMVPFVNFNVGTQSNIFDGHMFFNNAIAWGNRAEDIVKNLHKGDYVYIKGRLQSRDYVKKFTKRWKTPGGNRKKKVIELPLKTREVSISYVEKLNKKAESKDDKKEKE